MSLRALNGSQLWGALLAAVVEAMLVGVWFATTTATGKTYHLDPALVAAAPAVVLGIVQGRGARGARSVAPAVAGLVAVAGGWWLLAATGNAPTATFFSGQPGGVPGEVAAAAVIGAAAAVRWLRHGRAPGVPA